MFNIKLHWKYADPVTTITLSLLFWNVLTSIQDTFNLQTKNSNKKYIFLEKQVFFVTFNKLNYL